MPLTSRLVGRLSALRLLPRPPAGRPSSVSRSGGRPSPASLPAGRAPLGRLRSSWSVSLVGLLGVVGPTGLGLAACSADTGAASRDSAYRFLDAATDACGQGTTPRLPASYRSGLPARESPDVAYTYDVALTAMAYTARGQEGDLERARAIGDALVQAQAKDTAGDGRLRNAYDCHALSGGRPAVVAEGTSTGNMAWAGLALLDLHRAGGDATYLDAAEKLGTWILTMADTRGPGGFVGGLDSDGTRLTWKSTEHNLDVAAFLDRLAGAGGRVDRGTWQEGAASARRLVTAMWSAKDGHFWVGTTDDGATANTGDYVPEDVQAWSALVLRDSAYDAAPTWALARLSVTDGSIRGVKVGSGTDPHPTVWLEGNAHMAAALGCRAAPGDDAEARTLLHGIEQAQQPGEAGGIPAASRDGTAGGDDVIYAAAHTGTTAWYLLAATGVNPFGGRCGG